MAWVESLRPRFRTLREIAGLIEMSESGFTRGVKRGTLSIENLLQLASATDTHPSTVLRVAKKGDVADQIERLYGVGTDALTSSQAEVLDLWSGVSEARRAPLLEVLRVFRAAEQGVHNAEDRGRSSSPSDMTDRRGRTARRRRKQSDDGSRAR